MDAPEIKEMHARWNPSVPAEGDRVWIDKIPAIKFPQEWSIRIIPPFSGAVVRFQVEYKEHFFSIYLDCYGILGRPNWAGPYEYWECYGFGRDTNVHECIRRYPMEDAQEMITEIEIEIDRLEKARKL